MLKPRLLFLARLYLHYLSRLMNDSVCHDPTWPLVPAKLPLDVLKFEGKKDEDHDDHVMNFHLWFS